MANIRFILLTVAFASAVFSVQATARAFRDPNVDLAPALGGAWRECSLADTAAYHGLRRRPKRWHHCPLCQRWICSGEEPDLQPASGRV